MKALGAPSGDDIVSCEEECTAAVGAFDVAVGPLGSEWSTPHPHPRHRASCC